ncbi:hypothetical protein [Actinomadura kijaniata]|uniref:hypothetical protein n=1 Tax=Actinomadura kijaniata TaxID=46161 RepID=UPI0012FCA7E4|nr:hypothetical protein [Actinomadura kijaniata]
MAVAGGVAEPVVGVVVVSGAEVDGGQQVGRFGVVVAGRGRAEGDGGQGLAFGVGVAADVEGGLDSGGLAALVTGEVVQSVTVGDVVGPVQVDLGFGVHVVGAQQYGQLVGGDPVAAFDLFVQVQAMLAIGVQEALLGEVQYRRGQLVAW